jgi:hypothetical protein
MWTPQQAAALSALEYKVMGIASAGETDEDLAKALLATMRALIDMNKEVEFLTGLKDRIELLEGEASSAWTVRHKKGDKPATNQPEDAVAAIVDVALSKMSKETADLREQVEELGKLVRRIETLERENGELKDRVKQLESREERQQRIPGPRDWPGT